MALDPQSVEAQSRLAVVLADRVLALRADSGAADLARGEVLVNQALAGSPCGWPAHFAKGHVLRAQKRWEEAVPEYEAALALNHNFVGVPICLAWCKLHAGSIEEVIPLAEKAIRLSPRDPAIGVCYNQIGTVHLLQSRTDDAIIWLEKARSAMPALPGHRGRLAAAYALRGETERAAAELADARSLASDDRFSSIAHHRAFLGAWLMVPKTRAWFEATYFAGLRKAGMPEE